MSYRVVHYINQFFAQIGGEEKADVAPELREGKVGPGLAFEQAWKGEAEIVATVVCGDSYFAEHEKDAKEKILAWVKEQKPDLFLAGPAFNAGRYGYACASICQAVQDELNIPVLTGMYEENPGADLKNKVLMVSTANSAAGMRKAAPTMAKLAMKLVKVRSWAPPARTAICPTASVSTSSRRSAAPSAPSRCC
jgi:glycine reductase